MKKPSGGSGAEQRPLADADARRAIVTNLDVNMLVEAGAGSGKTHSLAARMVAGILSGKYQVPHMAAVTFTRKAAAELRGRFQQALEERLATETDETRRERLRDALAGLERLFAGTIHSFCAHLLRERPVEANLAPGFTELDEMGDAEHRRASWQAFIARERGTLSRPLRELEEAGIEPADLLTGFATLCTFEEVEFPPGDAQPPDLDRAWAAFDRFWIALSRHVPERIPEDTTCKVQDKVRETTWRLRVARRGRLGDLMKLLEIWEKVPKCTQYQWNDDAVQAKRTAGEVQRLVGDFQRDTGEPVLAQARQHVYRLAIGLLSDARGFAREARYRALTLNYNDLLGGAARLLRANAEVRGALREKYRWLFVDEFQDTDPIQADMILLLAGDEAGEGGEDRRMPDASGVPATRLRPGALFVVGDPKQSIFRFRRADIQSYNRVRDLLVANGGQVVRLTTSFRALPELCRWNNDVFGQVFPPAATEAQPQFQALADHRSAPGPAWRAGAGIRILTTADPVAKAGAIAAADAAAIARYIRSEMDHGRRKPEEFLIITWKKAALATYAAALQSLQVPVEVSGGGAFAASRHVRALAALLHALADPDDAIGVVGVLRGELFGIDDDTLFRHKQAGGWFSYRGSARRETREPREGGAAVVRAALNVLDECHEVTRTMPAGAAVERILGRTGLLALAAAETPGGGEAGDLLQAVGLIRRLAVQGYTLADLGDALETLLAEGETESVPLEAGRTDVVRVMNLHKAKGLEAAVVFLADPCGGSKMAGQVSVRIDRAGDRPRGYLRLVQHKEGNGFPHERLLGEPAGWADHEAAERPFALAEVERLRYVAATRARDLLVVSRWTGTDKRPARPWEAFQGHLQDAAELSLPRSVRAPDATQMDLSAGARTQREHDRATRLRACRAPSFAVESPTTSRRREIEPREDDETRVRPGPAAGIEWGTLVHELLELALRHPLATRADIERMAAWLTLEDASLRAAAADAVTVVERVRTSEAWRAVLADSACQVEVPFAVLRPAGAGDPPTICTGVVDLVYRAADGWRIVDHKTDRLAEVDEAAVVERHDAQLASYADAWRQIVRGRGAVDERVRAGLHLVRSGRIVWR
jgi:ATP-dependent helicase/nuclease subunit A